MSLEQTISALATLSVDDRLRIVQELWDSIPADAEATPSPAQEAELKSRIAAHMADRSSAISPEELARRLRGVE